MTSLEPSTDAMEVKSMVTNSPSHSAFLASGASLVGLALDAEIHDVVPADSTVIDNDVPSPESDGVPLLDLEALGLLGRRTGAARGLAGGNHRHVGIQSRHRNLALFLLQLCVCVCDLCSSD